MGQKCIHLNMQKTSRSAENACVAGEKVCPEHSVLNYKQDDIKEYLSPFLAVYGLRHHASKAEAVACKQCH